MPGPGLDLIADEELAELADVIRSGRLRRCGPEDGSFPAKVRRFDEAVPARSGVRYALASGIEDGARPLPGLTSA